MLINPKQSSLLIIDIQEKLITSVHKSDELIKHTAWLTEIANKLEIPVLISEQYPKGLGKTVGDIAKLIAAENLVEKITFSCMQDPECSSQLNSKLKKQVIITGMETHVCVLQTAMQLKQQQHEVFIVEEAVSSRYPRDKKLALARMRQVGIQIVSREMVAFEWLQTSASDNFKTISKKYIR